MKGKRIIEIANSIIDNYCEINEFDRTYFKKKIAGSPVKIYRDVRVYKHRQVLSLYLNEILGLKMVYIGELLGYKDHSTVSFNNKKFKHLISVGDDEINMMWSNLCSWANEIIKKEYEEFAHASNL